MRSFPGRIAAIIFAAVFAVLTGSVPSARGEDFPKGTIRIIVGPSADVIPRLYAEKMQKRWGTPVIVEPRPGAGGDIAARSVSAASRDGYTLLNGTSSYTLNMAMHSANYDFVNDFDPIAMINMSTFVLVVNKSLPVTNLQELIALAKTRSLSCGSSGIGTPPHLGCELFNAMAGVRTVHVPFREANAPITALIGDHVQLVFGQAAAVRGQIDAGQVRALAVTTPARSKLFPDLPTVDELGLRGFDVTGWGSIVAPAGTPKQVIETLNAEIVREAADPEIQQGLARIGIEPAPLLTPAEVGDFFKKDIARCNRIIDMAGIARAR
jgi:tripartite-type tricarboxylate transporter receptor subunit TctC